MNRPLVTSGGRGGRADSWRVRMAGLLAAEADGPEVEARRWSQRVTCGECGGQATAYQGRVFISHGPKCQRAARRGRAQLEDFLPGE